MKKETKALLFTQGEAGIFNPVPFELEKSKFYPDDFKKTRFRAFSEVMLVETNNLTIEIEGTNVFALAFSDGSVWDTAGWRDNLPLEPEWVNNVYNEKTAK